MRSNHKDWYKFFGQTTKCKKLNNSTYVCQIKCIFFKKYADNVFQYDHFSTIFTHKPNLTKKFSFFFFSRFLSFVNKQIKIHIFDQKNLQNVKKIRLDKKCRENVKKKRKEKKRNIKKKRKRKEKRKEKKRNITKIYKKEINVKKKK